MTDIEKTQMDTCHRLELQSISMETFGLGFRSLACARYKWGWKIDLSFALVEAFL